MEFKSIEGFEKFVKILVLKDGKEIGRCRIFLIRNDLHEKPYVLLEDVFINEEHRNKGIGNLLVKKVIKQAKSLGCYKIIATSRFERENVHEFYKKLGFERWGYEFRINLK